MGNLNRRAMRLFDRTRWQQRRANHFSVRAFTRAKEDLGLDEEQTSRPAQADSAGLEAKTDADTDREDLANPS